MTPDFYTSGCLGLTALFRDVSSFISDMLIAIDTAGCGNIGDLPFRHLTVYLMPFCSSTITKVADR